MILVLGKGVSNDGVVLLLEEEGLEYEYLELNEVKHLNYEYVVKAPGISKDNTLLKEILSKGLRVITDIELAMKLRPNYYIGVTGSNGKTTTTSLITHIISAKYKAISCGNIGYSVCRAVVEHKDADVFVVELSSFQLEFAEIDLNIAVILNVNPCHLDHHVVFKNYIDAKSNISKNQSHNNYVVYYYNDHYCKEIAYASLANRISFSTKSLMSTCYQYKGYIYFMGDKILKISNNIKNKDYLCQDIMASISATLLLDKINPRIIRKRLKTFNEIEYRFSKINDFIYNDAKSTNPYSTIAALKCLDSVFLICGGYLRNENLNCLKDYLHKLKKVFVYGESKEKVFQFMNENNINCEVFDNLEEAFKMAIEERRCEEILYSPMFASFDQYKNYIERGEEFNNLVDRYIEKSLS